MGLRLWPEELEPLRAEAREVVARQLAAVNAKYGQDSARPTDRDQWIAMQRAAMSATYSTAPDAVDRMIAGVRCAVIPNLADGPTTAVYLHFHGGGMTLGAPEMNTIGNIALSRRHAMTVVSVDYRLAPEHPYPAAVDDAVTVARWVMEHGGRELGADGVVFAGESAGAYVAAAALLRLRDELGSDALGSVLGANLSAGVYDWGMSPSQRGLRAHPGPDVLDPEGIAFCGECFLPGTTETERRSPSVSPAYADLHGMPPAFFSVGACDHLVDDTVTLAGRWAAVNDVDLFIAPDMPHGFSAYPCAITDRWRAALDAWFTRTLGDRGPGRG